jgi:GxxExxY protein
VGDILCENKFVRAAVKVLTICSGGWQLSEILTCKTISTMNENEITFEVRGAIFDVYNTLGPGLLESAYSSALQYELTQRKLKFITEYPLPMVYKNVRLDVGYRIDILVENKVIVEVKSIDEIAAIHHKQLLTYLRLSGKKVGILVNFNTLNPKESIIRKVNNF